MGLLAARVAAHAPVDDPIAVAMLLARLQAVGEEEQAEAFAARAAHAPVDNPTAVTILLVELGSVSKVDQGRAMINPHGSGKSDGRSVDGAGIVFAGWREAWSAIGAQQAAVDQRHTVPYAHRHTVA
ncbi:hypothetical protein AB0D30_40180 [Streptomyces sp. NPDC048409]|uniref:hypothetical protein n=1 Tax=Streptomyces sp. NPDC048409 TaxID=3154723 RepID=UPI00342C88AD